MNFKRIYVEITNICNKNCSFCSKDTNIKRHKNINEFEHILKQIKPYTNYICLHIKGEPLFHPNIEEIFKICDKYQIYINLTTNGSLIHKNKENIINSKYLRQINISLHSFEKITEEETIETILKTVDEIQKKSSKYIVYRFWAIKNNKLTKENEIILNKLIKNYNIENMKEDILKTKNIKIENNIYINKAEIFTWPNIESPNLGTKGTCLGLKTHLGILVDGTIVPCCLDSKGIINLGNIFHTSFKDILSSSKFKNINQNFRNNILIEELCQKCQYIKRCEKPKNMI
ncbi:MAG: radical SAM/SPASM domain-containing protein [Bacilli bacterium]